MARPVGITVGLRGPAPLTLRRQLEWCHRLSWLSDRRALQVVPGLGLLSCRACPINLKPGPAVRRLPTVHPGSACRAGPRLLCCRACSPTGPAVAGVPGGLVRALKAGPSRFYSAGQAVVLGLLSCPGLPGPAVVQACCPSRTGPVVVPGRLSYRAGPVVLLRKSTLACSATTPCPCTGPVIPMITLTFI